MARLLVVEAIRAEARPDKEPKGDLSDRAGIDRFVGRIIFTALLEAGSLWGRRGYEPLETLRSNFTLATLDVDVPPVWQVLAFGLLFVLAAAYHEAFRVRAASLAARQTG